MQKKNVVRRQFSGHKLGISGCGSKFLIHICKMAYKSGSLADILQPTKGMSSLYNFYES